MKNGGAGHVQSKIRLFENGSAASQGETSNTELRITQDKDARFHILARVTDDGQPWPVAFDVIRHV